MVETALQREKIAEDTRPLICFVCTGNTCRSPMAEALVNGAGGRFRAVSAGLAPCVGEPIAKHATDALLLHGVVPTEDNPYEAHTARPLTEELAEQADLIVGMTGAHLMQIFARFPGMATKLHTMPKPISDPYLSDLARYRACLAEIEAGLKEAGWLC